MKKLLAHEVSRIIEMAWEDRTPFEAIKLVTDPIIPDWSLQWMRIVIFFMFVKLRKK